MKETNSSLDQLQEMILNFRDARDWKQFHTVKNLLLGLGIEVAELQELFLWKNDAQSAEFLKTPAGQVEAERELADVFIFIIYLADAAGVDLESAVTKKLEENSAKYPVEKAKGRADKYNQL